jgi:tRNA pseudouridine65 synthase
LALPIFWLPGYDVAHANSLASHVTPTSPMNPIDQLAAPLPILYRDDYLVAVHKPSGLLVHRSLIDRHETRFALQLVRDQIGQRVYPVHRLDKPTSGVLLFALDSDTAGRLGELFSGGQVSKRYLAVVRGYTAEFERIDYALQEHLDKMTDRLARQDKPAQSAVTSYQRLATVELPHAVGRYPSARYSLVAAQPETGRKHQLRRHFKHIFHPIVGDTTYGDGRHNQLFREQFSCQRLLLAATVMMLPHPFTGEPLVLRAPISGQFAEIIDGLGWSDSLRQSELS